MSINYAKIGKLSRRLSLNSDLIQIHMSSQNNKTLNNSYSVSLHQSKQTFNNKNISKVDIGTPLEDPKSQLISSKSRSEYQIKKFSIEDKNKITNFLNAIDDYIKQLDENSDCHTVKSDSLSKLENILFVKYNIIQKQQEQLKIKYKKLQQNYVVENYENQTLKNELFDLHNKLEELKKKNYIQQLILEKQKQQNKELKYQYLYNFYVKEKMKYENQKQKILQNSISIQENNIILDTKSSIQIMDYKNIKKFLQLQMKQLKYNNRQIDDYSNLYKKFSDHKIENF